jgi:hypothetical protein
MTFVLKTLMILSHMKNLPPEIKYTSQNVQCMKTCDALIAEAHCTHTMQCNAEGLLTSDF